MGRKKRASHSRSATCSVPQQASSNIGIHQQQLQSGTSPQLHEVRGECSSNLINQQQSQAGGAGGGFSQTKGGIQQTGTHQIGCSKLSSLQASSSSSRCTEKTSSLLTQQIKHLDIQDQSSTTQGGRSAPSRNPARFPLRPGKGIMGQTCLVKANHFFAMLPDKDLFHYDVTITPQVTARDINRAVIKELVDLYQKSDLGGLLPVFDGRKSLYTAGPLPFTSKDFEIILSNEGDGIGGERREKTFKVVIKFAAHADINNLRLFLSGKHADAPQEALQILDIVLRELPSFKYTSVGRSFYSPQLGTPYQLGDCLISWRGFYQSLRPTQSGLSLNVDMSATAFIEPLKVNEFVSQIFQRKILNQPLSDEERVKVRKMLRGLKVEVTHRGNIRRRYRIAGLTQESTAQLTFPVDELGKMKSVVQYFQETYSLLIVNTTWPCLVVGNPERPNYLPMEVCRIVEGQRYTRKLSDKQTTALLRATCQRPQERERAIMQIVHRNAYEEDKYAKEFGLKIDKELATINARVLPAPRLKYHDSGEEKDCLPKIGQWNMMRKKVVNGGKVSNWTCINFSRYVDHNLASQFCQQLANMCRTTGMQFSEEPLIPLRSARADQVETALVAHYQAVIKVLESSEEQLDLLIAILPDSNGSLYGELKRICETSLGIVSQCCLTKNVQKLNRQYLANVALKINVKVGGRNTVLVDALSKRIPLVSDRPTIIFGADVTHPNPGEDSSPSIAALVASQDWPEISKYAVLVSAQAHRQELIQDLYKVWDDPQRGKVAGGMVRELLISFKKATGSKPERIIFYRDGVSEGQFNQVLVHELDAIRKACASLEANYHPPVTFVVVQKRHHTRLFPTNPRYADKSGNILPGTVVDTRICHPTEFDFYLCSHPGLQGTSRPAHYHVLWDENKFTADVLQSLTNNLCYTYARCTHSVSVVPPAYYAHLAAFRARFYVRPPVESGSMASGHGGTAANTRAGESAVTPLPPLKENVKRVMFYC